MSSIAPKLQIPRRAFNSTYIPFLENKAEFLHFCGGAGSGKSRFVAQKEIALSYTRYRRKTLVVRKVHNTLRDSCFSELKQVIYQWGREDDFTITVSPLQITNNLTETTFIFRGFDDPEKIKSVTGVDRVWYEEATESTSKDELDQLRLRLRGFSDVQITLSYNPINVFHYLNTEYHEKSDPRHFVHRSTYKDNEKLLALDPTYGPYIESTKETNPAYYKVYGLGEWGQNTEGLVYPEYQQSDDMPDVSFYGLDFGHNDPTALVSCAVRDAPGKKEFYVRELLYKSHLDSNELIAEMKSLGVSNRFPIICDSARPEMIDALKKAGFNAKPCTKYKGSVLDGINRVKTFTIRPVVGSKNLFRELQNYSWLEKDGKFMDDEPKDAVNHLMDAMRYASETQNIQPWTQSTRSIR
jgi:phage terminase large subunit